MTPDTKEAMKTSRDATIADMKPLASIAMIVFTLIALDYLGRHGWANIMAQTTQADVQLLGEDGLRSAQ